MNNNPYFCSLNKDLVYQNSKKNSTNIPFSGNWLLPGDYYIAEYPIYSAQNGSYCHR